MTALDQDISPASPAKKGMFGPKQDISPMNLAPAGTQEFNKLNARIRISEERYLELRKKLTLIEQNMLAQNKKQINDIRSLAGDLLEMKRAVRDVENKIMLLIKELQFSAKKEDVDLIKKYLEFWEPVKFVTANQVERMIAEAMGKDSPNESQE